MKRLTYEQARELKDRGIITDSQIKKFIQFGLIRGKDADNLESLEDRIARGFKEVCDYARSHKPEKIDTIKYEVNKTIAPIIRKTISKGLPMNSIIVEKTYSTKKSNGKAIEPQEIFILRVGQKSPRFFYKKESLMVEVAVLVQGFRKKRQPYSVTRNDVPSPYTRVFRVVEK